MNKLFNPKPYILYSMIGAIAYCIPVIVFLSRPDYSQGWLLYLGNLLFLFAIVAFLFKFNKKRDENASTMAMLASGHIATLMGVIIACLLAFILQVIMVPGYLSSGTTDKVLTGEPANMVYDKTRGMSFMVFVTATIGNFSAGSFVSIIFPFALKADQTRERVPRKNQAEL